jgi:hypothetical protein
MNIILNQFPLSYNFEIPSVNGSVQVRAVGQEVYGQYLKKQYKVWQLPNEDVHALMYIVMHSWLHATINGKNLSKTDI